MTTPTDYKALAAMALHWYVGRDFDRTHDLLQRLAHAVLALEEDNRRLSQLVLDTNFQLGEKWTELDIVKNVEMSKLKEENQRLQRQNTDLQDRNTELVEKCRAKSS